MKRLLVLAVVLATMSQVARADHIGLYTDASGRSCEFAPGFTTTPTVIHKFSAGATSSHFAVEFPAGTNFFAFNSSYTVLGNLLNDITIQYGGCLSGNFALGTVTAILTVGVITVVTGAGYPGITYLDCNNVEHPATGGASSVGGVFDCPPRAATEASTWGAVKALYQ